MDRLNQVLALIGGAAKVAGNFGVPVAGLVGSLLPIANEFIASVSANTGKTREEIIAATGVVFDEELEALLTSDAKGE